MVRRSIRVLVPLTICLSLGLTSATEAVPGDWIPSDQACLHTLFGPDVLASNVCSVRRHAAGLPLAEKFDYLKSWVLPGANHPDIRVNGEFTPTNPSPRAMELEPDRFPTDRGGEYVSPVFDLLHAASELKRLDDLHAEVTSVDHAGGNVDVRAKLVLLTLIRLEQNRSEDAGRLMTLLHEELVEAYRDPQSDYSAELLLLYDAVARRRELALVGDLLVAFHDNRFSFDIADEWESHLCTLVGHYPRQGDGEPEPHEAGARPLEGWSPAARSIAMTRGNGYPQTIWHRHSGGELHLRSGHHRDYLFFASPLSGNYEVAGDVDLGGRTQIMTGGLFVGPRGGRTSVDVGKFRSEHAVLPVDPPFSPHDPWVRYRAVVRDGHLKVFLNERLFVERELGAGYDLWIAARGVAHSTGPLRHLQIGGDPRIPDQVDLSSQAAFSTWYTYYFFTEDAGNPQSLWQWDAGENGAGQIVARRHPAPRGSSLESILRYHRPLVEDCEIDYEFFYAPDDVHVHPAFDRLAFLLQPEGVGLHWCTDGKYDRTSVSPEHVLFEQDSQRGSRPLPLAAGTWNHMKVSLAGQTVSLILNGRLIFEQTLPESNLRTFGFFRYADRTLSRVRSVTLRGDWPKSIPPAAEQKLADPRLATSQKDIADLPGEFRYDFVRDASLERLFKRTGQQLDTGITEESDGVHVRLDGDSGWTVAALMPRVQISGDFDIRAEFELEDFEEGWQDGLAFLEVRFADRENHYFRAMRGYEPDTGHSVRAQVIRGPLDGRRQLEEERVASWAAGGCFRIVRAGDRLTSLFAPRGSSVFRVLGQEQIDAGAPVEDVLLELAVRDASQGHVVWKSLTIRAERVE
ncbi:DUF1583 domain-containing protein [Maioricimonas sp. JC845]|uniref:DUF1583 domain-containing protein n=1 Tax=Maioricimonas sp. JC845 TaxID=3232138 RepID=UPI00345994C1